MTTAVAPYEIAAGGALHRIERAARLTRGGKRDWMRRAVAFVALVYGPLLVIGVGHRLFTGEWIPALRNISTHVRALVAIPLLLAAERFVDDRARGFGMYLLDSGLVRPVEATYEAIVARSRRLRDSSVAEAILLALAISSGFVGRTYFGASSLVVWSTFPAIIVVRFLLLRWVWRWLLWVGFLWRVSRLPLALRATHPDRLAGLGPLLGPAYAFGAVVLACSCVLSASWADLMIHADQPLSAFYDLALAYFLIALALALAPGCVFIGVLYRVRKATMGRYGALAQRYVEAFDARWIDATGEAALGAADISGLVDLGSSYSVIPETRVLPWSPRVILTTAIGALVPMVPLAMLERGVWALVERLGKALL